MDPDLDAWDAWSPQVVADRLAGVGVTWCVAAGWALDLFRGQQSRPHSDLEIAVPTDRSGQILARFDDCDFFVPRDGEVFPMSAELMRNGHQTWAREKATGRWRVDVFREPHDGDTWICRRDARIRRPYADVIEHTADGIPYLAPEIVLLFKAKKPRAKDLQDFEATQPLLDPDRRRWLHEAVALVHPGHPWLSAIA